MKTHDLLELATRNLRESLLRNSLTTAGVSVGVASLVAMLSLGVGLQAMAGERLSRSGLFDTVVVFSRRDIPSFDRAARRANPNPADARRLDETSRQEMVQIRNVVEVYPEVRFPIEGRYAGKSHFATVAGLPPSARQNDSFENMQGHFFTGPEADEAILHVDFARDLSAKPAELLGQELILRYAERQPLPGNDAARSAGTTRPPAVSSSPNDDAADEPWGFSVVRRERKMRIIGIVETEPFGGMRNFARGRIFIPIAVAEKLDTVQAATLRDAVRGGGNAPAYVSLLVRVASPSHVQAVQDAIKKMGFTTWSILDATRNLRRFFAVLDLFLGIFGSLALAVASLGIVNTLVMAILERRREIGIMKALGASDRDVKRLFFAEAGAMGLAGGLLGVTLGWAIGRVINFGTNLWLQRQELPPEQIWRVPWWLVLVALAFSVLVSLAAGLYPAARAAKLDPVQALRYE
jgi:putative ABC transport system permease protein